MTADDDLRQPRTEAGQGLLETLDATDGSALAQILAIEEQAALAARSEPRCEACARGDRDTHAQHVARSEPRSCDPREHGGKHAPWCHAARSEPRAYEPLSGLDALRHGIEATPRAEGLRIAADNMLRHHNTFHDCEIGRQLLSALAARPVSRGAERGPAGARANEHDA